MTLSSSCRLQDDLVSYALPAACVTAARLGARALVPGRRRGEAARELTAALSADPDVADAWKRRGQIRSAAGDDRGALEDLTRAVALVSAEHAARRAGDRDGSALQVPAEDAFPASPFHTAVPGRRAFHCGSRTRAPTDIARLFALVRRRSRAPASRRAGASSTTTRSRPTRTTSAASCSTSCTSASSYMSAIVCHHTSCRAQPARRRAPQAARVRHRMLRSRSRFRLRAP